MIPTRNGTSALILTRFHVSERYGRFVRFEFTALTWLMTDVWTHGDFIQEDSETRGYYVLGRRFVGAVSFDE
jgi:hypothetical protein